MIEEDMVELAAKLLKQAEAKGVKFVLPEDVVMADEFKEDANTKVCKVDEMGGDWMGLDIGPKSIKTFEEEIGKCNTIVFNGPMGVFEMPAFATGTITVAELLAKATSERGATTIVGGGDSVAAVNQAGLGDKVSHISTEGGASLELLEGKELPGVAALSDA